MLLAIDAGNTNISLALFNGEELIAQWRLQTDVTRTNDEYDVEVCRLFETASIALKQVDGVVIASVVPQLTPALQKMAKANFALEALVVDHTASTGLKIIYDPVSDLGADRIADAVGALAKYGAPCVVVDCGTATTFNVINAAGEFVGGAICPGLMTCAEALFSRAAKLPRVAFKRPAKVIGSSTISAMQSGLYHGYVSLVDGMLEKIVAEMNFKPRVIATGGLAPLAAGASQYITTVDDTLTLEGLRLVYERNRA